jgi:transcriptional antiterminator RfaH
MARPHPASRWGAICADDSHPRCRELAGGSSRYGGRLGWRPILSTYGVRSIVRSGQDISCIDHAFIASLRDREVDGAIVRPLVPYKVGQSVKIAEGPFDGLVATIIDMDEKNRLVVLLELMNRSTKVMLGSQQVTAA